MPQDLLEAVSRKLDTGYFRFLGVELSVPDPEMVTTLRNRYGDGAVNAQYAISWEPLSYVLGNSERGNVETDYVQMTGFGGLDDAEIAAIRELGFAGVPQKKIINRAENVDDPKKLPRKTERFYHYVGTAGLRIQVEDNGSTLNSPDIGVVFRCHYGVDTFPRWNPSVGRNGGWDWTNTAIAFVRYPLSKEAAYVAPENPPIRMITKKATEAPSAVLNQSTAASSEAVVTAAATLGLIDAPIDLTPEGQMSLVARAVKRGVPALAEERFVEAAQQGKLFAEIVEASDGVLALNGDLLVRV